MKWLKESLSPATATNGMMKYWKGNFQKSHELLSKAKRWCPEVVENSIFEGYLGLSLYRLGKVDEAMPLLLSTNRYLKENPSPKASVAEIESQVLEEIKEILGKENAP